ncbi:hypothetical protein TRFO_25966 [Tritrichomonas foetus]|uniref:Rab-GAP TBC domain-containing protein n=1 Tax=Tritrichomonas foetus TaxID=1144522 RepID=A0A1J4K9I3_9EUKA|nr:hypothetical protein TRFO_25966 [Tritrichomonas foetus]|eukprot:OHT06109.1 hypothetical protein TRFO_25966 [Tritrichomonas foetus]
MSLPNPSRQNPLASLEPAIEVTNDNKRVQGILIVSRVVEHFQLFWRPLDGSPVQHVNSIFQEASDKVSTEWTPNTPFDVDCRDVALFSFSEESKSVKITIKLRNETQPARIFSIDTDNIFGISTFLQQLLSNGIAVPCHIDSDPYSLEFYRKAHTNTYYFPPPHIQLDVSEFGSLDTFWSAVNEFFQELMTEFDESETLPRDPLFPLGVAATSAHYRLKIQINDYISKLGTFEPIKKDEIPSLFDEKGVLKDPKNFKERIFHSGVEESARAQLLPFIFGVYDLKMTQEERDALDARNLEDFKKLDAQVDTVKKHQLTHYKKLGDSFRVITQDVDRTDRNHNAFKSPEKPGMTMLTRLLRMYCMYNPPISYLQGMNDLFVPIIHSYFPIWNENGDPVDNQGQIVDHLPHMPAIFWDYEAMLRNIDHLSLLSGVTEQCMEKARTALQIIQKVSPMITIWYKKYGLSDLLWIYADFVLLFKRTFSSIWDTWLQFNCSPDPKHWLIYFTAAIILDTFPQFSTLSDVSVTVMMDAFPKAVAKIDVHEVGNIALWLHEKVPFEELETENVANDPAKAHFDFFQLDWIEKAE